MVTAYFAGQSERGVLCLKSLFDLNGETNRVRKKQSSAIIAAEVRRFGYVINKDGVLGTHRIRCQERHANR
jgi:hypothetical protein